MKQRIVLFILSITISLGVFSQNLPVSATVNKQKILIGEHLQLYLKAVVRGNNTARWFRVDSFSHFEILKSSKIDSQQTSQGLFLQQTITLTSWDSGKWAIPSFSFGRLQTKPLVVSVEFSPMDPNQPYHDIKDIIDVQKPIASNWYWYLLGVAVLIALFLLFFPPKEKKEIIEKPLAPEDVYKNALNRLDKLSPAQEVKSLYTELVDILRDYLHNQKGIQSFSKTTDDLSVQIGQLQLPEDDYYQLVLILQMSDMVKFAKLQPSIAENEKAIDLVRKNIITIENLK